MTHNLGSLSSTTVGWFETPKIFFGNYIPLIFYFIFHLKKYGVELDNDQNVELEWLRWYLT